jgi:hypothetical protein
MGKAKMDPVIADEVPWSDHVTEYDEEHFIAQPFGRNQTWLPRGGADLTCGDRISNLTSR